MSSPTVFAKHFSRVEYTIWREWQWRFAALNMPYGVNGSQRDSRTGTFTKLLTTVTDSCLRLSETLMNQFHRQLVFEDTKPTMLIEVYGQKKGNNEIKFPSKDSKTYLKLPRTFESDLQGDNYSYVGVLYDIREINELLPGHQNAFGEEKTVNSKIVSFAIKVNETFNLRNPVTLILENTDPPQDPPYKEIWRYLHEGEQPTFVPLSQRCSFWNFSEQGRDQWDTRGCREVSSSRDQTVCECSHLTNFGVLMDLHGYVIGCTISGIFLHFIFLCAFMWMAMEGLFIYRQLVLVFPSSSNLSTRAYFIIGYGVPSGIVGITAAVSFGTDSCGYGSGEL
ncbi:unnamed protein product [Darwinula stevensoni]|uniref:Uncharacterized protein n=1 Tax=Darwinula stevensoni TaxID=69355 RepID=A0A7R9A879_9CRUS|nr:unnamed protein product [Darwinula stevensoni]CAG0896134.1 unnamed protein product [Darwinula stevensoni]